MTDDACDSETALAVADGADAAHDVPETKQQWLSAVKQLFLYIMLCAAAVGLGIGFGYILSQSPELLDQLLFS